MGAGGDQMNVHLLTFDMLMRDQLPAVHEAFHCHGLRVEFYCIDWWPASIVCHIASLAVRVRHRKKFLILFIAISLKSPSFRQNIEMIMFYVQTFACSDRSGLIFFTRSCGGFTPPPISATSFLPTALLSQQQWRYFGAAGHFLLVCRFVTLYSKSLPLDIAARIWDLFLMDPDYLYLAGLGVLPPEYWWADLGDVELLNC